MRNYLIIGCLVLLLVLFSTRSRAACLPYPDTDTTFSLPASLNERIEVMTDRYIYGVGEKILFAGISMSPPGLDNSSWSKVLYMELLTPGGTSVARGKFPYLPFQGIRIPHHPYTIINRKLLPRCLYQVDEKFLSHEVFITS